MAGEVRQALSLLEDGYQVSGMTTTGDRDKLVTEIRFFKGNETRTLRSSDEDFFIFSRRFIQVEDRFGNYRFVLRDSPQQPGPSVLPTGPNVADKFRLKIGDVDLGNIFTLSFSPSKPGNSKGFATFIISLKDNPDFLCCDLRDELVATHKETNQIVFRGLIRKTNINERGDIFLECQDRTLEMDLEKISVEFGNVTIDALAFIAEYTGFNYVMPPGAINNDEREFTIITPVKNLIINRQIRIGDVTFYQIQDSKDDELIRKSNNGLNNMEWNGNFPKAKITVRSTSLYKASVIGYEKISQAIDAISLRTDISFPRLTLREEEYFVPYDYYRIHARVKPSSWIFCRAKNSDSFVIFNQEAVIDNYLTLEYEPERYILLITKLFEWLITKEPSVLSQAEKNVLQVIHWLRRSIQQGSEKDQLLDLWTALEFLISGTKAKKMFDRDLIEQIKQQLNLMDDEINPDQMDILEDVLNRINDAPLMVKVKTFQRKYDVSLSDHETESLAISRKKRNNIIHGICDETVSESELSKTRYIVEKLLLAKVANMGGFPIAWPELR